MADEGLVAEASTRECHGFPDGGSAVKAFRYGLDPLCVAACVLYAINRFWFRHFSGIPFFIGQFDDSLLIPCALPPVLWLQRRLGLRDHDRFPDLMEITFHLVVWSVIAEVVAPRFIHWVTGDWKDVVAYTIGALIAGLWWHQWTRSKCLQTSASDPQRQKSLTNG